MTTLTITLDDSPEAQLIITLLKQAEVVTSIRIKEEAPAVWKGSPPAVTEIRHDWDKRNQQYWELLRATPTWTDAEDLNQP